MKTKRSHRYRITEDEAKEAWLVLNGSGPIIDRLRKLLLVTTGKRAHPIG
jgi:hypothetical protein